MDLNKLKTFYTLAKVKNYSKCAEKLFVSQSAVSHAIKALETSLGMPLTEKRKNGFALTPRGQVLFESCQTVFSELATVEKRIKKAENIPETIRLGCRVEFGISVVIRQLARYFEGLPNLHVDFTLSHNLLVPLLDDELDMIIDCRPYNRRELSVIPLFREEYAVIVSPGYLARHRILTPKDLENCNLFSIDKEMVWWGNFMKALPESSSVRFTRVTQVNHIRGIIEACLADAGIGFVPRYTVMNHLESGRLKALFEQMDIQADQISIYMKDRMAGRPGTKILIEQLEQLPFR